MPKQSRLYRKPRADASPAALPDERLYVRGDAYFIDLLRDIHAARQRVDLETYIFELDPVGQAFIAALGHARGRGVRVRLLVDGIGLPLADGALLRALETAGVPFRIFHPVPWFFRHWRHAIARESWLARFRTLLSRLNHRNHRKVCCIDRHIAWVGSFNVTARHLPKEQGGEAWRDTAVRIENIDTALLERAFERAWNPWSWPPGWLGRQVRSPFRLNETRRKRRRLLRNLVRRIERSRERIWITNAYFVPDERLLLGLSAAARRGVDVRIILPSVSDVFFMPWTAAVFYRSLLEHGVRIYEYQPGILHAKTIVIDDWMTVGSSNLNSRSILHDLEIDYVLGRPETRAALAAQFIEDLGASREVSRTAYAARPRWQRWLAHGVLFARHWL
jgi:cardiolipin synthase